MKERTVEWKATTAAGTWQACSALPVRQGLMLEMGEDRHIAAVRSAWTRTWGRQLGFRKWPRQILGTAGTR